MRKSGKTILGRVLVATLLPLVFIFSMVILTLNNIIFKMSEISEKKTTTIFAEQCSRRVATSFATVSSLLNLTGKNLSDVVERSSNVSDSAIRMTHALMDSNLDIFCAWVVFEPGVISEQSRFAKCYIRKEWGIQEIADVGEEALNDPARTPWYHIPLTTHEPYFDSADYYDYGIDEGRTYVGTISYPIFLDGDVVGNIGADMVYEQMFGFIDDWEIDNARKVLLVADNGRVLYSNDDKLKNSDLSDVAFSPDDLQVLLKGMEHNESTIVEIHSPFFNKKSWVCLSPINVKNTSYRLFLYMDLPLDYLFREANSSMRIIISTSVMGLMLLAVSVFFATRNIVKPIRTIIDKADRIANGDLDVSFDEIDASETKGENDTRHEVDILRLSLKKMLEGMHQNHQLKLAAIEAEFQRRQIEESAEEKSRFFANMSHEIRTPMNAILGMSEILLMEPLSDRQKQYIKDIKVSSTSLLSLVNDILDFSKLESGKLPLVEVHYDFRLLIENISSICMFLAKEKGLDYELEMRGEIPDCLYGDDVRIRQILLNMLSNAVKFSEKGRVSLLVAVEENSLVLRVSDTGIGIRAEEMGHLFEAFKQVDAHKNRKLEGTGLGLSICKYLVDAMGGTITVESVYGKGSVFTVEIPKKPGDKALIEEQYNDIPTFKAPSAKILVVDDNDVNLNVAVGLLRLFGVECDTALSGEEGIERIRKKDYDIVFMDHMMPEMDGVETTRSIRGLGGKYENVVIVALTANALIGAREFFLASGMNDFLSKPIEKQRLLRILVKWLPREKVVFEEICQVWEYRERDVESAVAVSSILKDAEEIEGLDIKLGLERVAGQIDVYEKSLRIFYDKIPVFVEALKRTEDLEELAMCLHSIKGSAANIGAMPISSWAGELEKAALAEDGELEKNKILLLAEKLESLAEAFHKISPESLFDGVAGLPQGEPAQLEQSLSELEKKLSDFQYERALEIVGALLENDFGRETNRKIKHLETLISRFDYDAAIGYIASEWNAERGK